MMTNSFKYLVFLLIPALYLFPDLDYGQNTVVSLTSDTTSGYRDGGSSVAQFKQPFGMCMDNAGNIYIADAGNNCIRKISTSGIVSTYAGNGIAGSIDGQAANAQFNSPSGVCIDSSGNLYVADFQNHSIRKITSDGNVSTIAGSGQPGYSDGFGTDAQFDYPRGICIDASGVLYVSDSWNHRIRKITQDGNVTTFAGGGDSIGVDSQGEWTDAQDTSARFFTPCGLSIDNTGNIYVADALNHRIRKIDGLGNVTTIAGSGDSGWNAGGFNDGQADSSKLNTPTELFVTNSGDVIFSDTYGNRIRKVSIDGFVSTIAGTGDAGLKNGDASTAQFNTPRGVVADSSGSKIYVIDSKNNLIRVINLK